MTQDYERFTDHHRLVLLRYLDGTAAASAQELDALGYVESVLKAWQEAFGVITFGLEQADKYYDGLISRLQAIANNPERARTVDHVWPGMALSHSSQRSSANPPAIRNECKAGDHTMPELQERSVRTENE